MKSPMMQLLEQLHDLQKQIYPEEPDRYYFSYVRDTEDGAKIILVDKLNPDDYSNYTWVNIPSVDLHIHHIETWLTVSCHRILSDTRFHIYIQKF